MIFYLLLIVAVFTIIMCAILRTPGGRCVLFIVGIAVAIVKCSANTPSVAQPAPPPEPCNQYGFVFCPDEPQSPTPAPPPAQTDRERADQEVIRQLATPQLTPLN